MGSSGPFKQRNFLLNIFSNLEKKFLLLAQNWSIFQTKKISDPPEKPDFPPEKKNDYTYLKKVISQLEADFSSKEKISDTYQK